jgi:hypothetical protein
VCAKIQEDLLKESFEARDEVIYKIDELMERWDKRLTFQNLRFTERFVDSELEILIRYRFIYAFDDPLKDWIACLEPVTAVEPVAGEQKVVSDREEKTMLVDIIKLMDFPERFVSTLVRFEPVDRFYSLLPHSLYLSSLTGFVFIGTRRNRERNVAAGFSARESDLGKVMRQVVESTPDVLDDVSCRRNDVEGEDGKRSEAMRAFSSLRITMHPDNMHILVSKHSDFGIQLREVLLGPFDLYPNKHKPIFGSK